ncbi:potassium-transporting ATPase subunit B, partial [mine drainage metagenome]
GALTTFSITNDVAKYFAILPAIFITSSGVVLAGIQSFDVLGLSNPNLAVLATLLFNALVIPLLIPLALTGVRFRPRTAIDLLRRNLIYYGVGGLVSAFVGIKLLYLLLAYVSGSPFALALGAAVAHFLPIGGV